MRTSVILVAYNSADVIATALDAAHAHLPDAEVIVVDNGSTDATRELVALDGRATIVHGHGNVGFGGGVNRGARAARGTLLLVINPDAFLTSVDHEALAALAERASLGMLGCQLRENGRPQRSVQVRWGWRRELCWTLVGWYLVPRQMELVRPPPRQRSNRWVAGAAFIVNRDEFIRVGGFDERLFLYYEDFDLSRTYASAGLPLGATSSVTLDHVGHASSPRDDELMTSWTLMGLIEQAGKWDGFATSQAAARWAWRLLGGIEMIGRAVGRAPWIGPRGRRKARSAAGVRSHLRQVASQDGNASHYPLARAALAAYLAAGGSSLRSQV